VQLNRSAELPQTTRLPILTASCSTGIRRTAHRVQRARGGQVGLVERFHLLVHPALDVSKGLVEIPGVPERECALLELDEKRPEKRRYELIASERLGVPRSRSDPVRVVAIRGVQQRTKPRVTDVMSLLCNGVEPEFGQSLSHFDCHPSLQPGECMCRLDIIMGHRQASWRHRTGGKPRGSDLMKSVDVKHAISFA